MIRDDASSHIPLLPQSPVDPADVFDPANPDATPAWAQQILRFMESSGTLPPHMASQEADNLTVPQRLRRAVNEDLANLVYQMLLERLKTDEYAEAIRHALDATITPSLIAAALAQILNRAFKDIEVGPTKTEPAARPGF